jgi:hypothetical protein
VAGAGGPGSAATGGAGSSALIRPSAIEPGGTSEPPGSGAGRPDVAGAPASSPSPGRPDEVSVARPPRRAVPGRAGRGVRLFVPQQLAEQLLQFPPGIHAELVGQGGAGPLVGGQRLGAPPGAVQRPHQQQPPLLPQRLVGQQPAQLGDHLAVPPAGDPGFKLQLGGGQPQLVQPFGLGLHVRRRRDVGQRGATPQRQRLGQQPRGRLRVAAGQHLPALAEQRREPVHVQVVRADQQLVARRPGPDHLPVGVPHEPAQPQHVQADQVGGGGRRVVTPQLVDQGVGGHDLPRAQQQPGQHRPPFGRPD